MEAPLQSTERWDLITELFERATALSREEAFAVLPLWCKGDPALLRELKSLLREHYRYAERPERMGLAAALEQRFSLISKKGSGTFGDVYQAHDTVTGRVTALKVLRDGNASALLYFKREFRRLADIKHPNIVKLDELIFDGTRWVFTMEFVDGKHFIRYIRGEAEDAPASVPEQEYRVRAALPQLASALNALHGHGLLHRDVKPSNVLVTTEGRVVLLDFGLVRELNEQSGQSLMLAGTPNYMSPEQAASQPLTEASDWYSLGVMLYQALTGVLPHTGTLQELIQRKQTEEPIPPNELIPSISKDLSECCMGLLDRAPRERLRFAAGIRALYTGTGTPRSVRDSANTAPPFLGREEQLERLHGAYVTAMGGRPVCAHVRGPSGIGKSGLIREFVRQLRSSVESIVVFAGRCYERESVPYSGLDDLVDSLSQYLRRLPRDQLEQFLPRNFHLMARMFPVLGHLEAGERRPMQPPPDTTELRSRAFSGLRELIGRIAERRRLVLIIDDLQWADLDGCAFLHDLMSSPDAPPLLLLLSYRSEDNTANPGLQLLTRPEQALGPAELVTIDLGRLSPVEARELLRLLAEPTSGITDAELDALVLQSSGDPFLIHEIAAWISNRAVAKTHTMIVRIEDIIRSRLERLSAEDRHLLELIAISGQPTELRVLGSRFGPEFISRARDALLGEKLLRSRVVTGRDEVEVYHDRIRAAVISSLDSETMRSRHGELARALEMLPGGDPERIAIHYHSAEEWTKSRPYAMEAAQKASGALAFNKAATYYRLALDDPALEGRERGTLLKQLGDTLSSAGRGTEAAEAYLQAAGYVDKREAVSLESLAAGQFLRAGHIQKGSDLLQSILREARIWSPRTRLARLLWILYLRLRIRMLSPRFQERSIEQIPPDELFKLDLCWTAAVGMSMVHPLNYAEFSARYFLMAHKAGEPYRLALAFAAEAPHSALAPSWARHTKPQTLLKRASELANRIDNTHAKAFVDLMGGTLAYIEGNWTGACKRSEAAAEVLRSQCAGVNWELSTANTMSFIGRSALGQFAENRRRLPALIKDAEDRGDLFATLSLRLLGGAYLLDTLAGRPEKALMDLERDLERWPHPHYDMQKCNTLLGKIDVNLYLRTPERAWEEVLRQWPLLLASDLMRVPTILAFMSFGRGRLAIAMALRASESEQAKFLKLARAEAKLVLAKGPRWSRGLAHLLLSGIAGVSGNNVELGIQLSCAEAALKQAELIPFWMVARFRQRHFEGPAEAARIRKEVENWAEREGVASLADMFFALAPGRWPEEGVGEA